MACTYLLTLDEAPSPPKLEQNYTAKQWAKLRTENMMKIIPEDEDPMPQADSPAPDSASASGADTIQPLPDLSQNNPSKSYKDSLKGVLDLHTAQRMKVAAPGAKVRQGVSIPSQRRWLHYWALLLAHEAPPHLWNIPPSITGVNPKRPKVRLTQITLRMKDTSAMRLNLVKAVNAVMDRTSIGKRGSVVANATGNGHVWVSLARYDDEFVGLLERWEALTRDGDHLGRRRKGSGDMGTDELNDLFKDGKWDKGKMVRSFARMGATGDDAITKTETENVSVLVL